uniref:Phosphatidic acid phosphatase type 2/haloperoxidase domain-containing protein n=1 Tax=viral metagenome TaxID=1070528 RepID=A0A6C0KGS7_9ZZZZ
MAMEFNLVNILQFFSYISPLLIGFFLVMGSLLNKDLKGIVYLGGVLIFSFIGMLMKPLIGSKSELRAGESCNLFDIPFVNSQFNSPSFHSLFIAFTIVYLFMPMLSYRIFNYPVIIALILLFCMNSFFKVQNQCTTGLGVFLGALFGIVFGIAYWAIFHYAGLKELLYFQPGPSNNIICNKPSRQTFKCKVYKNGKLVKNL